MASLTFDISDTQFYKDVSERERRVGWQIDEQYGRQIGELHGRLQQVQELLREGDITQETFDRKVHARLSSRKARQ